jgi:uncharacterized protein YdiU (UPF0061 family)
VTIPFDNSYARLPERFYARLAPIPVGNPDLVKVNAELAAELGLDAAWLASEDGVDLLAGNRIPEGAEPLAQAYAGHQFGGFVPQLGDGRAILLGEVVDQNGERRDIQLKGSGPTPFSRGGDGRAWIGPVLREYLLSEAMHALAVPTTRALAAVTTGEMVFREGGMPGAILTRVAGSHLRIGSFQFFAARQDKEALQALFDYAVARHDPEAKTALEFVEAVIGRQARLVARWLGLGFIHGVMNTDNVAISGETIDYGPCAFLDRYHPLEVYSSIDLRGRYAYGRQPEIMVWNLAQLASTLLPLIDEDQEEAVAAATQVIERAPAAMDAAWLEEFRRKLGLVPVDGREDLEQADAALIRRLLKVMYEAEADFTNTFRSLPDGAAAKAHFGKLSAGVVSDFDQWTEDWEQRLRAQGELPADIGPRLHATNPRVIPRNHRVEEAIQAGLAGDFSVFERLLDICTRPFEDCPGSGELELPPKPDEVVTQTFCGT